MQARDLAYKEGLEKTWKMLKKNCDEGPDDVRKVFYLAQMTVGDQP
jgi:hypothetical protein